MLTLKDLPANDRAWFDEATKETMVWLSHEVVIEDWGKYLALLARNIPVQYGALEKDAMQITIFEALISEAQAQLDHVREMRKIQLVKCDDSYDGFE